MGHEFDIIIAGAGASGLCAAINAKKFAPQKRVAVLEHLPRVGKKILATGNGRCNLSNMHAGEHPYKNRDFARDALNRYDVSRTLGFFKSIGLLTYTDECGRIYPLSNTASGVLDALRFAAEGCGVEFFCGTQVKKIKPVSGGFLLNGEFSCQRLLIAAGGQASPAQGSDGSGYGLLKSLGHSITPLCPSLVQLTSPDKSLRSLKGVRVHDTVINLAGHQSRGELLFTDYGLSGIAAMEISRAVGDSRDKRLFAEIDLLPEMSREKIAGFLGGFSSKCENMLNGILPKAVGAAVLREAGISSSAYSFKLSIRQLDDIANAIKHFKVEINGTRGFESAQVTSGGADINEFHSQTLMSKLVPSLWCAGEILDVDGGCGGFNLQWAWSSGLTAGEEMAK